VFKILKYFRITSEYLYVLEYLVRVLVLARPVHVFILCYTCYISVFCRLLQHIYYSINLLSFLIQSTLYAVQKCHSLTYYTSLFTVSGSKYILKNRIKKEKNTQTIYKMSNQTSQTPWKLCINLSLATVE